MPTSATSGGSEPFAVRSPQAGVHELLLGGVEWWLPALNRGLRGTVTSATFP